jgi:hypothetical protein
MAKKSMFGLDAVEFGDIATDGGVATTFSALGLTFKDTFEILEADPTETDFFSEENDDPELSITTKGALTMKFQLMNFDAESIAELKGGSVASDIYSADSFTINIEKSVKVTPKEGFIFTIPRAKITAKFTGKLSKSELMNIEVMIKVMNPKKTGTKPYTMTPIA